jgi:hypothetical protein
MSLFSIFVDLKANTADFVSGMERGSYAAKKAGREIQESFSSLGDIAEKALAPLGEVGEAIGASLSGIANAAGKAASGLASIGALSPVAAIGGIAAVATAAAVGLSALAIKGTEVVENFRTVSEQTGISISDLQVFGAAGESVGVSLEDVVAGMRKFDQVLTDTGRGVGPLQATLKSLGITAVDNRNAILQLADAFKDMPDGPRKAAIAIELLGRSGLSLIPILDQGREGIEEFQGIVKDFGPNIDSGAIAATEEWKKSTVELGQAWGNAKVSLGGILPVLESFVDDLAQAVKFTSGLGQFLHFTLPENSSSEQMGPGGMKIGMPVSGKTDLSGLAPKVSVIDDQQDAYDAYMAGGKEQLALKQAQEQLDADSQAQLWKAVAADEAHIASLKEIIALEQSRQSIFEKIGARIDAGDLAHPTLAHRDSFNGPTEAQTAALPTFSQLGIVASPQDVAANNQAVAQMNATKTAADAIQSQIDDFWKQFGDDASNTVDQINAGYDKELTSFRDLLLQQKISQEDWSAISVQIEKSRIETIAALYQSQQEQGKKLDQDVIADPFTSLGSKFQAFANQIQLEGQNLGPKLFSSMSTAVDGLESQLAKLVVTGKANFKQLFDSFAESAAKAGIQNIFGSIAGLFSGNGGLPKSSQNAPGGTPGIVSGSLGLIGSVGKLFGLGGSSGGPGGAPTGSQASPFYVVMAGGGSGGFAGILSSFAGLGSLVGLAGGGDMTPGRAYLVGEKGPELMFAGKRGGSIVPIGAGPRGHTVNNNIMINGVSDFDSFNRSKGQIMADFHRTTQNALARNG